METRGGEPRPIENKVYGKTGEIGKDGLLTVEQHALLNRIQEKAARNIITYLDAMKDGDPYPMVAMATGIGKGNIIHRVIERQMRRKKDGKVLLIAGTKLVLVRQSHEALGQYQQNVASESGYVESEDDDELIDETTSTEENPIEDQKSFLYRTGKIGQKDANVHVATIQTVQSQIKRGRLNPDGYDIGIVDEVHNIGTDPRKATVEKLKRVVGFTATPYRHSGRMKAPEQYGFEVIESLPLPEAQGLRLLPPLLGIQIDTKDLVEEIPTTLTGKIDFARLERLLKNSPDLRPFIADRIANIINNGDRKYKTVIAVNFVWEAQELAKLLYAKGISVGVAINQKAAKEMHTEEIPALGTIERYKLPEDDPQSIQVLISPYVASEGFDAPATEVLVWASPTDSELRYTQYTGRLARRNEGKLFGVVVDCLYQTSQYNWSYNMGMWMKGDVQQLENGMLWLGPETDLETLKKLPQVEAIRKQADVKPIIELQKETLLDIQETDFAIIQDNLASTFMGGSEHSMRLRAKKALEILIKEEPELVAKRKSRYHVVDVATDRQKFIDEMLKQGAILKSSIPQDLEETDFGISLNNINLNFVNGEHKKTIDLANQVLRKIKAQNPELVVKRRSGSSVIDAVTDRQRFIDEMIKLGAVQKTPDIKDVQENDFVVSLNSLKSTFTNIWDKKTSTLARKVLEEIRKENPELVVKRNNKTRIVDVVTDRNLFVQKMVDLGATLKEPNIENLQETAFPITYNGLELAFIGGGRKLVPIAQQALRKIQEDNPQLIMQKKSTTSIVSVVLDRQRFIDEMVKQGAVLRSSEVKEIVETDFDVTAPNLKSTFVGNDRKLLPLAREVLGEIRQENPELIVKRKKGTAYVEAVVDKQRFIDEMIKRGVKLRENQSSPPQKNP